KASQAATVLAPTNAREPDATIRLACRQHKIVRTTTEHEKDTRTHQTFGTATRRRTGLFDADEEIEENTEVDTQMGTGDNQCRSLPTQMTRIEEI
ncbi:hypothetical protein BYT27DRAFT_7199914, partial [Phlegmacium glaucopus]